MELRGWKKRWAYEDRTPNPTPQSFGTRAKGGVI